MLSLLAVASLFVMILLHFFSISVSSVIVLSSQDVFYVEKGSVVLDYAFASSQPYI